MPTQVEAQEAVEQYGTIAEAARQLGCPRQTLSDAYHGGRPGKRRKAEVVEDIPETHILSNIWTRMDANGEIIRQTRHDTPDKQRQWDAAREAIQSLTQGFPPRPAATPPKISNDALMSVYPLADVHVGMYAWAKEAGADFDVDIAYNDTCAAIDYLVERSPPSRRAALLNLGDLFHTENTEGVTEANRNVLDMDTRFSNMFEVGLSVLEYGIARMLERHDQVDLVNVPGNHDESLGLILPALFHRLYANEPRITVHDNERQRVYLEHGKCLIGGIHGHKTKDRDLLPIMATEQPEAWGRTLHRCCFRGHDHHDSRVEYTGGVVEHVRTLSAADAYAVGHGYLSGRDLKCIVMHEKYGEQSRFTCGIDVLRDAEAA